MAQIGDLSLFITAETKRATAALRDVDQLANKTTKPRVLSIGADTQQAVVNIGKVTTESKELNKSLLTTNSALKNTGQSFDAGKLANEFIYLNKRVNEVKNTVNELRDTLKLVGAGKLVDIADSIGVTLLARFNPEVFEQVIADAVIQGVKDGSQQAKNILYENFFRGAFEGINAGINELARIGFAGQGLLFIIQPIKAAFEGLFNFTLGQNIKLQDTILSTATTLATTADVIAANGEKIVDPFERIVALQGPVENAIDSIRQRSLKLAGVTSSQVVDVFSVVATNIGQINGDLKDAEDLAIAFTASLGTLGIPLFQARQEIGSILGGYITEDSLLARRLGITNEQVREAKRQAGGVTKFLLEKLSTAEAGQEILAKGFRGVTSNIAELFELIGLAVGQPLLDPLVNGLNKAFEALFKFKQLLTEFGLFLSGTIVQSFETLFAPTLNSKFAKELAAGFTEITSPLKEIARLTENNQGSFLENAILGRNVDQIPPVLNSFVKAVRSFKNELMEAARDASDPLANILTRTRGGGGNPLRIASLPLGDPDVFVKGWDTLRSTLDAATKSLLKFGAALARFKLREAADTIRIYADLVLALGDRFLGAANLAASFFETLASFLSLPVVEYFNQVRIATNLAGISDFVDNIKILALGFTALRTTIIATTEAFQNYKTGLQGIAAASTALASGLNVSSTAFQKLSLSGRIFATAGDLTGRVMDKLGGALGYTSNQIANARKELGTLDSVGKAFQSTMRSMVGRMIALNLAFFALQLAIGVAITEFSNYMEAQRKARKEQEEFNRFLAITSGELERLSASTDIVDQKRFDSQLRFMKNKIAEFVEDIDEANQKLEELRKEENEFLANPGKNKRFGELAAGFGLSGIEMTDQQEEALKQEVLTRIRGDMFRQDQEILRKSQAIRSKQRLIEAQERKKDLNEEARLQGKRRKDLEKQIAKFRKDLNREIANREFSMRQQNARKLAQAELEEAQLSIRLAKERQLALLEGEEGAAAAGKRALAEYISVRDNAEANRQNTEKNFQIEISQVTKDLEDYRFGIQEKITEMQKKVGEYQKRVADYISRRKANDAVIEVEGAATAAQLRTGLSGVTGLREGSTGLSTGNHFHVEGVGFTPSEAGARSIFAKSVRDQLTTTGTPGPRKAHPVTGEESYHNGFDLAGPSGSGQGLPFNLAPGFKLTDFQRNLSGFGNQATVIGPDGVAYTVSHLADPGSNFKLPSQTSKQLPVVEDFPFPDISLGGDTSMLDPLMQSGLGLSERLNNLKNARGEAQTNTAFDAIFKSAFPLPGLKSLKDEIALLKEKKSLESAFNDPRRLQIEADFNIKRNQALKAETDLRKAALKDLGENSQKMAEFDTKAAERRSKVIERLEDERKLRIQILEFANQAERLEKIREVASITADAMANAFTTGFAEIMTGVSTVQDVLLGFFKQLAAGFSKLAQSIIADMIRAFVVKKIVGLFGNSVGSFSGGASVGEQVSMPSGVNIGAGNGIVQNSQAQGFGTFGPNYGIRQFAKGGVVTRPTAALIGEGGMNEAVVPLPNGRSIPVDFKKGAGGNVNTNITVNVEQSGNMTTEMSGDNANKLGKAIDKAIKRVIIEEKRAGGILYSGRY